MTDVLVVRDEAVQVVKAPPAGPLVVGGQTRSATVVSQNLPGPPGHDGVGGGATYIQESTPQLAAERETWFNPTTHSWYVFTSGAWQPVYSDGGFF